MLKLLSKIIFGPIMVFFALLSNPFGWIFLGIGSWVIYSYNNFFIDLAALLVMGFVGLGLSGEEGLEAMNS
jgi:hypothetical protein